MSTQEQIAAAESSLGRALASVHRALAHLDEPTRSAQVQDSLYSAISLIESAINSHAGASGAPSVTRGPVAPEIVAAIAAAISTVLTGPYRLVSVRKVAVPVAPHHHNAWAQEGRAQIFRSHKVR